jgi:hypothetical protein
VLIASRAAARAFGSLNAPFSVLSSRLVVRVVAVSRRVTSSREVACETGTASAMSAPPVRSALVRAVPSAMNLASTPEAWARPPQ